MVPGYVCSSQPSDGADRESCIPAVDKVDFPRPLQLQLQQPLVSKNGLPRGHLPGSYHGSYNPPSQDPIRYVTPTSSSSYLYEHGRFVRVALPHCLLRPSHTCDSILSEYLGGFPSLDLLTPSHPHYAKSSLVSPSTSLSNTRSTTALFGECRTHGFSINRLDMADMELINVFIVGGNAVSAFLSWRLQATNACDVTLVWKSGYEHVAQYGISFK